jgi:hypothetical protein
MEHVYKFFNLGEVLIKWLRLLGTNRRAFIFCENLGITDTFPLEQGTAQGDNISAYTFILAYEILLFRLNYDQLIDCAVDRIAIPRHLDPLPAAAEQVNSSPPKVFAMADDATVITLMNAESLGRVAQVLDEFAELSGLHCNKDKTVLMQVGSAAEIPQNITDIGFVVEKSITLLGLKIVNDSFDFIDTFNKIEIKLRLEALYWGRFNLSLPGRITIAKTYLYSQLNYIGSVLEYPKQYLDKYSKIIETYTAGNLNIAKKRFFFKPEDGGLGLFDIKIFLNAQRANWIKKAMKLDDYWKIKLYAGCLSDVFNLINTSFSKNNNPVLYLIAKSINDLTVNFTKEWENVRTARIYCNEAVFFEAGPERRRTKWRANGAGAAYQI